MPLFAWLRSIDGDDWIWIDKVLRITAVVVGACAEAAYPLRVCNGIRRSSSRLPTLCRSSDGHTHWPGYRGDAARVCPETRSSNLEMETGLLLPSARSALRDLFRRDRLLSLVTRKLRTELAGVLVFTR